MKKVKLIVVILCEYSGNHRNDGEGESRFHNVEVNTGPAILSKLRVCGWMSSRVRTLPFVTEMPSTQPTSVWYSHGLAWRASSLTVLDGG